ncbi:MAG: hypothetical protein C4536_16470 [Actinobacteria bacterium]|jgi:hypothetical protein|nr:MAG: hypothetical protein C4536_16470 [Actinomycetota bacterium]
MFLLRRPVQLVINITVVVLIAGFLVVGAVMVLPSRSPLGPLLGSIASDVDLLSNMLANTEPKAVAQALNENPEFISELLKALTDEGSVAVIAQALNENPEMLTAATPYLDPSSIAYILNESSQFLTDLVGELDPEIIAAAVNQNGAFVAELIGYLDAEALNAGINANGAFLAEVVSYVDPQVAAGVLNQNGPFLSALMGFMDPAVTGEIVNQNGAFLSALVSYLDPVVIADVVNSNGDMLAASMDYLDPSTVAYVINANGPFVASIMGYLNPAVMAGALNANVATAMRVAGSITPAFVADILNNITLLSAATPYMQAVPVAGALMTATDFINDLISLLNPDVVADLINSSIDLVKASAEYTDPGFVADLISNQAMLSRILGLLDPWVLAQVLNANPDMSGKLIPLLSPAVGAGLGAGVGDNPGLLIEALNALNPAILTNAMNAHPEISEELSRLMPASLGSYAGAGLRDQDPAFIGELLANLNPAPLAAALGTHTGLVYDLVSGISPTVVRSMMLGSNRNPDFLSGLLSHLSGATVAGALNANPAFLQTLLSDLGGPLGTASAQGLTDNYLAGRDFLPSLISALNPAVVATAVNANGPFLTGFLTNASSTTAYYLALGINQNVATHPLGQDMLSVLIANISTSAAASLAQGINQNVAVNPTDNLLTGLLANTSGPSGVAIAAGLNSNPALVRELAKNINYETGLAAAQGINLSCERAQTGTVEHPAAYYQFLRNLLANLGPAVALASAQGLDANPDRDPLVLALVTNLDAAWVGPVAASAVNSNAAVQAMIPTIVNLLDAQTGITMAQAMNANPNMTDWMLKALDAGVVADLLNNNPAFLGGLVSNLDGAVVAGAVNAEYAMHPGSSLIERLLSSPEMNGANLADSLDAYGLNFLTGLLGGLDGTMVAAAINGNPGATTFLADVIAYLNPYFVAALINESDTNGAVKNLITWIHTYYAHSANPIINLLIQGLLVNQDAELQIRTAQVFIPPNRPITPLP